MRPRPVIHFAGQTDYEVPLPHHPPERLPELDLPEDATDPDNRIYAGVRQMLRALGDDASRFDTPESSPLSELVGRGGRVLLKLGRIEREPGGAAACAS